MVFVEGPELEQETLIFQVLGILLHPDRSVGGCKGRFSVQFEAGPGAGSTSRCYRGDAKQ